MTAFVDTSGWYAAADAGDRSHQRATALLQAEDGLATSDHVVVETWWLLRSRLSSHAANRFWESIGSVAAVEFVREGDLERALGICRDFADQDFSIVDCTSFAVMERLGLDRAISFDNDFVIYRYGPGRRRSFTIPR